VSRSYSLGRTSQTDLSLSTVVSAMVDSVTSLNVVASFCEHVMQQKEAAERSREEGGPTRSPESQAVAGPEAQTSRPDGATQRSETPILMPTTIISVVRTSHVFRGCP
jgi:hypothetical protein